MKVKLVKVGVLLLALLNIWPSYAGAVDDYDEIIGGLMCPACLDHGEILASGRDAGSEEAKADIKRRLGAGESKEQIIEAYVAQYGEVIRAVPTKTGFNAMAWIIPPIATICGIAIVYFAITTWVRNHSDQQKGAKQGIEVDLVDQARIDEEMRKYL